MTTIIGVDFSGAAADRNTWYVQGSLEDGTLLLETVQPIRREDLYILMLKLRPPAVAAMDFPFGLPEAFLSDISIGDEYQTMADIWPLLAYTDWQDLQEVASEFVHDYGEPRRATDHLYPEASSTLHRIRPDLLLMTHKGSSLLTRWWDCSDRPPWHVLPLNPPLEHPEEVITLMETMPGAFLRSVGLPYRKYKKAGATALANRERIINGLEHYSGIALPNLSQWRYACRANDDCLDSVVAAVCAAAWKNSTLDFRAPQQHEEAAARREGWLYAPVR